MAFGGLKGTLTVTGNSITNPFVAGGVVSVAVGDLVFCVLGQQTNLTVTGVTDNLGNTYNATNAGTDAGNVTGRAFYARVTTAGTLSSVSAATTASTNDAVFLVAVIEGPFVASPLDANPANITTDITSPFTCPATGTLAQANEAVLAWGAVDGNSLWSATSPNLLAGNLNNSTNIKVAIGYQAVSATTSVAPEFTAAANPTQSVLGTSSFKQAATNKTLTADGGSYSLTGTAATLTKGHPIAAGAGSYALTGTAATVRKGHPIAAAGGSYALTGAAASVKHAWILTAAAGSYALTGTAATVKKGLTLSAGAGSYALTGTAASVLHAWRIVSGVSPLLDENGDPILDENGDPILDGNGGPASYVLSGTAATLNKGQSLSAGAGSYSLTGTAANLLHGWRVSAGAGAYTLNGQDATLATASQTILPAGVGTYSLDGSDVSVSLLRKVIAESGIYLLSGSDVDLIVAAAAISGSDFVTRARRRSRR